MPISAHRINETLFPNERGTGVEILKSIPKKTPVVTLDLQKLAIQSARDVKALLIEALVPHNGKPYCADFAFAVRQALFAIDGRFYGETPVNAWHLWKSRDKTPLYDIAKGEPVKTIDANGMTVACKEWGSDVLEFLRNAPAGTLLTLRYRATSYSKVPVNKPTHCMVSLGNGIYISDLKGADHGGPQIVDFNRQINDAPDVYGYDETDDTYKKSLINAFMIVPQSAAYLPEEAKQSPLSKKAVALTPKDFGVKDYATPGGFADKINKKYGILYTVALAEILKQNHISGKRTWQHAHDLKVELRLPIGMENLPE